MAKQPTTNPPPAAKGEQPPPPATQPSTTTSTPGAVDAGGASESARTSELPLGAPPATPRPAPTGGVTEGEVESLRQALKEQRARGDRLEAHLIQLADMIRNTSGSRSSTLEERSNTEPNMDMAMVVNLGAASIYTQEVRPDTGRAVTFEPGVNILPRLIWERVRKHKTIQRHLEAGAHFSAKSGLREAGSGDVAQLTEDQACLLMSTSADPAQIEGWLTQEKRHVVRAAGERQLQILKQREAEIAEQMAAASSNGDVKLARTR